MSGQLAGRTAVITGAGSGIGKAIAIRFAAEGARVVLAGRRAAQLDAVAKATGGRAVPTDVTDEAAVARLFAASGAPDIIIANAGVTGPVANAADMDMRAWDDAIAINVRGVILTLKHGLKAMIDAGKRGSVVAMSSLMGLRGYPMRSCYVATKFAVQGITQSVAQEAGPHGIRVNALCPGAVNGELMERVIATRARSENRDPADIIKRNYTDVAALRRWVEPEQVADAALFLASDQSASITGEHLRIDCGRM
jgi:NAD(P)-dependent dehydrogenase (short-subunit alcohol dehydrogenase family)